MAAKLAQKGRLTAEEQSLAFQGLAQTHFGPGRFFEATCLCLSLTTAPK